MSGDRLEKRIARHVFTPRLPKILHGPFLSYTYAFGITAPWFAKAVLSQHFDINLPGSLLEPMYSTPLISQKSVATNISNVVWYTTAGIFTARAVSHIQSSINNFLSVLFTNTAYADLETLGGYRNHPGIIREQEQLLQNTPGAPDPHGSLVAKGLHIFCNMKLPCHGLA